MKKTLREFHFDPERSGHILKDWAKGAGKSYQKIADETNYSYDTINNSLAGKNKELSLERVFKIAVCTGHSVCEYIRGMLKDEEIDFADQIHVLREGDFSLVPYKEEPPEEIQALVQHSAGDTGFHLQHEEYEQVMQRAQSVHQANLERITNVYDDYLAKLEATHADALARQEKAHQEYTVALQKVAKQRLRWIIILAIVIAAVVVWFIWDLTHPEIGLIRLKQMGLIGHKVG